MPVESEGVPTDIASLRREYTRGGLEERDAAVDAVEQFRVWFAQAVAVEPVEATAMTLSTATREGVPSARVVLLKAVDHDGFVFYTSYGSRKGREIEENPRAALTFYWGTLERQVRIEGDVERISEAESTAYFRSRPRGSQVGAIASPQSEVIGSRAELEERMRAVEAALGDAEPVRPATWGGYRVRPRSIELWQGRTDRLHDRLRYTWQADGTWTRERLAP